jgi:hypothetical protein
MASNVFPFLNTGQMFTVFHMAGIVPDSYDILNMTVSIGAMNGASSFKTIGVILSGPAALVGFSVLRSFSTPDTVMLMSFISGVVPSILHGWRILPLRCLSFWRKHSETGY